MPFLFTRETQELMFWKVGFLMEKYEKETQILVKKPFSVHDVQLLPGSNQSALRLK